MPHAALGTWRVGVPGHSCIDVQPKATEGFIEARAAGQQAWGHSLGLPTPGLPWVLGAITLKGQAEAWVTAIPRGRLGLGPCSCGRQAWGRGLDSNTAQLQYL